MSLWIYVQQATTYKKRVKKVYHLIIYHFFFFLTFFLTCLFLTLLSYYSITLVVFWFLNVNLIIYINIERIYIPNRSLNNNNHIFFLKRRITFLLFKNDIFQCCFFAEFNKTNEVKFWLTIYSYFAYITKRDTRHARHATRAYKIMIRDTRVCFF
jgi:hypothetical protein